MGPFKAPVGCPLGRRQRGLEDVRGKPLRGGSHPRFGHLHRCKTLSEGGGQRLNGCLALPCLYTMRLELAWKGIG